MTDKNRNPADDRLMELARGLAGDVRPERDLWPEIEAAIRDADARPRADAAPSISPWNRYLAQAAAVILLVGASSGLTYLAMDGRPSGVSPVAQTSEPILEARSASFGNRYMLGPGFQDARRDLEVQLDRELSRLPPVARAEVETNMLTIRNAIDEISVALADEPDNVLLQELLLSSYQEELALMRKVNGITRAVMLREDF